MGKASNKIFDLHSNKKNFLYLDTEAAELVVNGNIHAKSLYLQEIGGENVIKYIDGKSKIDSPYLNVKGLNVNDNLKIDSNGILTTTGNIMSEGTITGSNIEGSNIEGSIIKGAKIFAGDDYTEQDIIDALPGTINGVTMEGSTIYSTKIFGISQKDFLKIDKTSKVVFPTLSDKSFKLMSGKNQKFGLTLGEDENQTVYMNLGQGTGGEVTVNDMVYGENSLMIQKADGEAKIYIVGGKSSIELRENGELYIYGTKVFINNWEFEPELMALQDRCSELEKICNRLQNKIEALESRPSM